MIPEALAQTVEWLNRVEDYSTARALLRTLEKVAPPEDMTAQDTVAYGLFKAKSYPEACKKALDNFKKWPLNGKLALNAAQCLNSNGQPEEAEKILRKLVADDSGNTNAWQILALVVGNLGRFEESKRILVETERKLHPLDPERMAIKFNMGWHHFRDGHFKEGLEALAVGRPLHIWGNYNLTRVEPLLSPKDDVRGKRVLIAGEGGAGDEILNARFARTISDRGGEAYFMSRHGLGSLLARVPGMKATLTPSEAREARYDLWTPCMDAPRLLGVEDADLHPEPYLTPDLRYVAKWQQLIPKNGKLRVGIRWAGNQLYENDCHRTVPFHLLERLSIIPGVEVYSLQRDEGTEARGHLSPVIDLSARLKTWEDTAAAISQLDLVVSSCTAIPHLALALGKPVWLCCPMSPYYVWTWPPKLPNPWYKDVRLFQQERFGDWEIPLEKIRKELLHAVGL